MPRYALLLSVLFAACVSAARAADEPIYTTFYPTRFMADYIAHGSLQVICPVPADADPIFWKPSRAEIGRFQQAALIIVNGAEYEKWVAFASLPESRVVDVSRPFKDQWIKFETVRHSHGGKGEHEHAGIDGHTWMDPQNAKIQARTIKTAMIKRWPAHAAGFEDRCAKLEREFDDLDARLAAISPAVARSRLVASHPAYNYIARRYGWNVENVALDPETPLTDAEFTALASRFAAPADGQKRILLWEEKPIEQNSRELSIRFSLVSVVFSPCETLSPEQEKAGQNYLEIMRDSVTRLESALK